MRYQNLRVNAPYARYFIKGEFDAYTINEIVKNKDYLFNTKIEDFLTRLTGMFEYDNMPEEIPIPIMERYLLELGKCLFVKHGGKFYTLTGNYGANPDAYGVSREFLISNPYIPLNKVYNLETDDCVLMKNDPFTLGVIDLILPASALLTEGEITFYNLIINARAMGILSADDDTAAESVKEYFKALEAGDHHVITTTAFSSEKGVESDEPYNNTNSIPYFLDLYQYIKSKLYADLGIQMTNNMKREYVSDGETSSGNTYTVTLVNIMLKERERAIEAINEKFGLDIQVKLSSAWELQQAQIEGEITDEPVTLDSVEDEAGEESEETLEESETDDESEDKEGDDGERDED